MCYRERNRLRRDGDQRGRHQAGPEEVERDQGREAAQGLDLAALFFGRGQHIINLQIRFVTIVKTVASIDQEVTRIHLDWRGTARVRAMQDGHLQRSGHAHRALRPQVRFGAAHRRVFTRFGLFRRWKRRTRTWTSGASRKSSFKRSGDEI